MVAITLSLLALKIDIVLEININSYSSTDRWVGISDFKTFRIFTIKVTFHFKISWTATLQFKESRKKERKHLSSSGDVAKKEKDWKRMKAKWRDRWKLYENLKLGDDFHWSIFKNYPHLRCYDFSLTYMRFLAFACFGQF